MIQRRRGENSGVQRRYTPPLKFPRSLTTRIGDVRWLQRLDKCFVSSLQNLVRRNYDEAVSIAAVTDVLTDDEPWAV